MLLKIIIVEILEPDINNSFQFLHQIKSIPQSKNIYNCSICNKEITDLNDTKYTCELCSMYLFCGKECGKNNDTKNI